MANNLIKNPNHPFSITGIFDVYSDSTGSLSLGAQYGYFEALTTIPCNNLNVKIRLGANISKSNILLSDYTYFIQGKFINTNKKGSPVCYYNSDNSMEIAKTSDIKEDFNNKVSATGLGIVLSREEVINNENTDVLCKVEHCDWDILEKKHIKFFVTYLVPGNRALINAQSLFRVGRELQLQGSIIDFDKLTKSWIVKVNSVSVTSGQVNDKRQKHNQENSKSSKVKTARGREIMILSSDESENDNFSKVKVPNDDLNKEINSEDSNAVIKQENISDIESGEISEDESNLSIKSSPLKRNQSDILNDARKRLKNI